MPFHRGGLAGYSHPLSYCLKAVRATTLCRRPDARAFIFYSIVMEEKTKSDLEHAFNKELAKIHGVEKAVLLKNFKHWCSENAHKKAKDCFHEGVYWTWESLNSLSRKYEYMNRASISRWVNELAQSGWLIIRKWSSEVNYYTMGPKFILWDRGEEWRTPEEILSQNETGKKRVGCLKMRQPVSQNETASVSNQDTGCLKMGHNDIECYVESDNVEPYDIENGETPFLIKTVEVTADNLKIETVEIFDFTLEETETQKKSSRGRGAAKIRGEYTNQDVARNLPDMKHQVFFTEVIQSGAWPDFLEYRKTRDGRIPYRDSKSQAIGVRKFYEACGGKSEIAQAVVDQSRGNGWMGLFPLKQQKNATNNAPNAPTVQRQHQGIATYLNSGGYSPFDFTADARPLGNT